MPIRIARLLPWLLVLPGLAAWAALPARDLLIELRQGVPDADTQGQYSAGPAQQQTGWDAQMLKVRNGEKATLRFDDAAPMQWQPSASMQSSTTSSKATGGNAGASPASTGSGATAGTPASTGASAASSSNSKGGAVTEALVWFDTGQAMTVQARWPGAHQDVQLDIEVQRAAVAAQAGANLPRQLHSTLRTSIRVPLGQWVSIAGSGGSDPDADPPGSYSSAPAATPRKRVLQVRVSLP